MALGLACVGLSFYNVQSLNVGEQVAFFVMTMDVLSSDEVYQNIQNGMKFSFESS